MLLCFKIVSYVFKHLPSKRTLVWLNKELPSTRIASVRKPFLFLMKVTELRVTWLWYVVRLSDCCYCWRPWSLCWSSPSSLGCQTETAGSEENRNIQTDDVLNQALRVGCHFMENYKFAENIFAPSLRYRETAVWHPKYRHQIGLSRSLSL